MVLCEFLSSFIHNVNMNCCTKGLGAQKKTKKQVERRVTEALCPFSSLVGNRYIRMYSLHGEIHQPRLSAPGMQYDWFACYLK